MTSIPAGGHPTAPVVLTPEAQQAVWFLGALVRVRAGAADSAGAFSVLEHTGGRGYSSPLHTHRHDEETFLVLEGELRVEVDGASHSAGPGAAAVLPRALPHAFVVTSPQARFLTIHVPAGFDRFTLTAGVTATDFTAPPQLPPPDPAELGRIAAEFGIDIIGPPPLP
jgi:quercetin dioxygenase-like cupin family protein